MSTIRILLGIFCLIAIGSRTLSSSRVLVSSQQLTTQTTNQLTNHLLNIARSQIGIREATGNNDGTQVEAYLKVTNLPKGNPWCAAFISWVYQKAGFEKPQTAWSPALFPMARRTLNPQPADVLGIYSLKLKRIAHAGLVERRQDNWIIAIEGNTNADGVRDGDGVYRKWRHLKTIKYFANWQKGGLK